MNKPPEKIFLTAQDIEEVLFHEAEGKAYGSGKVEMFEYHLAPVWHDAVKEPPKEKMDCLAVSDGIVYRAEWNGEEWLLLQSNGWHIPFWAVTEWTPLPLPPERSGK
jgi:hypothetical protein